MGVVLQRSNWMFLEHFLVSAHTLLTNLSSVNECFWFRLTAPKNPESIEQTKKKTPIVFSVGIEHIHVCYLGANWACVSAKEGDGQQMGGSIKYTTEYR